MSAEPIRVLIVSVLACSAAIAVMLLMRSWLRARFGAQVAYATWALVPMASVIALLPPPTVLKVLPVVAVSNAALPIANAPAHAIPATFDALPWLLGVWLLGACLALIGLLLQQRKFVRALGRLSPVDANVIGSDFNATPVTGTVVLRAESTSGCPALVGAIRPRIVLPADFEQRYDNHERELILAHERAHRARGDAQVNALAALLRCLFWFNPLVYFAASRFRFDQELACDAVVVARFPQARRRYADAMLKTQLAVLGLPVGCHWQSSHPLRERIAMLKHPLPGRARSALGFGVAAALIVCGCYSTWAAQPKTVSVAPASHDVLDAAITFRIADGAAHHVDVHNPAGVPFAVTDGRGAERWDLQGTANAQDDGRFAIDLIIMHGDNVLSRPRVLAKAGEPATVRVDNGTAERYEASIVVTRSAVPGAQAGGESSGDRKAAYRVLKPIAYPSQALDAQQQGVVYVAAHVDTDGAVTRAHVDHIVPADARALADAAVAGVKTWTFDPARKHGTNVASDEIVAVAFSLDPKGDSPRTESTALEPVGVSPEQPSKGNAPPSEDVSYRLMFPPSYPQAAIKAKQSARMTFSVLVDEHGVPESVAVQHADPPEAAPLFAQASVDAIKKWHFNPGIKNGKAHAGYIEVPIDFTLSDDDG